MIRRSRISIRPNVSRPAAGRSAATLQEGSSKANHETTETPRELSESTTTTAAAAVTDEPVVDPSEKTVASRDENDQIGEGTSTSAVVQRRKRLTIKPKVATCRTPAVARIPKSPVKTVSESALEIPSSDLEEPSTSSQGGITAPQGLLSPSYHSFSEENSQPQPTIASAAISGSSALLATENLLEPTHQLDTNKKLDSRQIKVVPPRPADKVPPVLPDRETTELSEKAKTLPSSKTGLSLSPPQFSLSRLLNDPSDVQRLLKAHKLKRLLKHELDKDKKLKKAKSRAKKRDLDPTNMTMRDLIHYLPLSNPMTSALEDLGLENETVVPPSPARQESPERAQEPDVFPKTSSQREEEEQQEEVAEEEQEETLMVPRVRVAEDGSLVIDEESLTVEVQRAKGPNPAQDKDPVFERGSTTTYSSYRPSTYCKPWSSEETDMFFLAISMVGTDFSMICQLFPHRKRSEIKNKFKKEERENVWRVDKAFRERRCLDIHYFSKLLEKIMEVQKNKKKLKSLSVKKPSTKPKKKVTGKKAAQKLSDVEEEDEKENEVLDAEEEEGEKENGDVCDDGGTLVSVPKTKSKRKKKQDTANEKPNSKKRKLGENSHSDVEACVPEDTEAAPPEDSKSSDRPEKPGGENAEQDTAIKPAKLSRGRTPKVQLPLSRKPGRKPLQPSIKPKDGVPGEKEDSLSDGTSKEQVDKDASPLRPENDRKAASKDDSSEDEDSIVQPQRPTRSGRVPKPVEHLNYPAKEDVHSSENTPGSSVSTASPASAKRVRSSKRPPAHEPKKPKLVTLRASQTEYSDEEEEEIDEEQQPESCFVRDSSAPAFVPATLRSPLPVFAEVEETVEELDILSNMPDVLSISQDALCPDVTGTAEPCEHHLDLLVDVIDFMSSENAEVSEEESYNEAAQTLLTIGNSAHLTCSQQNQISSQDHVAGASSVNVNETIQPKSHSKNDDILQSPSQEHNSPLESADPGCRVTEMPQTTDTMEIETGSTNNDLISQFSDTSVVEAPDQICTEQKTNSNMDATLQVESSTGSSEKISHQTTARGRFPKVKPKPNLGGRSRVAQSKFQPVISTITPEDQSTTITSVLPEITPSQPVTEKIVSKAGDCSSVSLKDDVPCTELRLIEKPSVSQDEAAAVHHFQSESCSGTSDQSLLEKQSLNISEVQFEPHLKQVSRISEAESETVEEKLTLHASVTEGSCSNLRTSESSFTQSDIGQGSGAILVPVQECSEDSSSFSTPGKEVLPSQKEENEVGSPCQTKKRRFLKVKPKPNLAPTSRAVHSKPQTTKDTVTHIDSTAKPPNPLSNPEHTVKTIEEVGPQLTVSDVSTHEKSKGPASVLIPPLEIGSAHTTEELSTTDGETSAVVPVDHIDSSSVAAEKNIPQKRQRFPRLKPKPNLGLSTRTTHSKKDIGKVSEQHSIPGSSNTTSEQSVEDNTHASKRKDIENIGMHLTSPHCLLNTEFLSSANSGSPESKKLSNGSNENSTTCDGIPTSEVMDNQFIDSVPEIKSSDEPSIMGSTGDNMSSPDKADVGLSSQLDCKLETSTRSTVSTMESTDHLATVSHIQPSEDGAIESNVKPALTADVHSAPDPKENTQQLSTEVKGQDAAQHCPVASGTSQTTTDSSQDSLNDVQPELTDSDSSKSSRKPRRGRLLKPKPNLASRARAQLQQSEPPQLQQSEPPQLQQSEPPQLQQSEPPQLQQSEPPQLQQAEPSILQQAEPPQLQQSEPPQLKQSEPSILQQSEPPQLQQSEPPQLQQAEPPQLQQSEPPQLQQSEPPQLQQAEPSQLQQSEPPQLQQAEPPQLQQAEPPQLQHSEPSILQHSEPSILQQSEPPQLQQSEPSILQQAEPPQLQQAEPPQLQQSEAASACIEAVEDAVSQNHVPELTSDIEEPVEGTSAQLSNGSPLTNSAGSLLVCDTQAPENSGLYAATSNIEVTQSFPSLAIFSDVLPKPIPSDPDEPFFILSLTEIPVSSSGEVMESGSEPVPYLYATDAPTEQKSGVPGESLAAREVEPHCHDLMQKEESDETGFTSVNDMRQDLTSGAAMEKPLDPNESSTVQPLSIPETVDNSSETDSMNRNLRSVGKRANMQMKRSSTRKKHASKTVAPKEVELSPMQTNTTEESALSCPPVQPEAFEALAESDEVHIDPQKESDDHVVIEKEAVKAAEDGEDTSTGKLARILQTQDVKRKPKGFLSFLSEKTSGAMSDVSVQATAASLDHKGKTPCRRRKLSTSASRADGPTCSEREQSEETQLTSSPTTPTQPKVGVEQAAKVSPKSGQTPTTSRCASQVSPSKNDGTEGSSLEEEPTSVSQYFLSDIFTDVDEG